MWQKCRPLNIEKEMPSQDFTSTLTKTYFQVGELLYCFIEGKTTCCFVDEKCMDSSWNAINNHMVEAAVDFMKKPTLFLDNLVSIDGYDSCHLTKEYDAEQCHQDCLKQEKSSFAKNCTEGGGLYKCCIR